MKYGLLIVVLLSGCNIGLTEKQVSRYQEACTQIGYTADSKEHKDCVLKLYSDSQREPVDVRVKRY